MVAAARKYKRVVQVGTQRKSKPYLIDAKTSIAEAGLLGKVSHVEMCCYAHMRANGNPPLEPIPASLDCEMWTGPAPLRHYDGLPHTRWWRTFEEYGNGIIGDMGVHMLDTVRWMLKLGWPNRMSRLSISRCVTPAYRRASPLWAGHHMSSTQRNRWSAANFSTLFRS